MTSTSRMQGVALTLAALGVAVAGTAFCIVQIYKTAQLPQGDGTGMQWVILTPLSMLFLFIVVPAFATALRGVRVLRAREPLEASQALPGRGWLIALGLLALYLLAPFILAPIFGLFMDE